MRLKRAAMRILGAVARWVGVVGLNYHRIGDGRRSLFERGLWSATEEGFDQQLQWLKAHFDVISPSDLAHVVKAKRGRHVLITFDDGYRDNHTGAYPLLRAHGLAATFFVATGFIDDPRLPWWDEIAWMVRTSGKRGVELPGYLDAPVAFDEPERDRAVRAVLEIYKALPAERTEPFIDVVSAATGVGRYAGSERDRLWMTWDMLREMLGGGMTIGGHTVKHKVLSRMPRALQLEEIAGCAQRLEQELGIRMRTFAYPVGRRDCFNDDTRACLREVGVETAFTYYGGFRRLDRWDAYDIPRIAVEQDTTFEEFRAMVMAPWLTA